MPPFSPPQTPPPPLPKSKPHLNRDSHTFYNPRPEPNTYEEIDHRVSSLPGGFVPEPTDSQSIYRQPSLRSTTSSSHSEEIELLNLDPPKTPMPPSIIPRYITNHESEKKLPAKPTRPKFEKRHSLVSESELDKLSNPFFHIPSPVFPLPKRPGPVVLSNFPRPDLNFVASSSRKAGSSEDAFTTTSSKSASQSTYSNPSSHYACSKPSERPKTYQPTYPTSSSSNYPSIKIQTPTPFYEDPGNPFIDPPQATTISTTIPRKLLNNERPQTPPQREPETPPIPARSPHRPLAQDFCPNNRSLFASPSQQTLKQPSSSTSRISSQHAPFSTTISAPSNTSTSTLDTSNPVKQPSPSSSPQLTLQSSTSLPLPPPTQPNTFQKAKINPVLFALILVFQIGLISSSASIAFLIKTQQSSSSTSKNGKGKAGDTNSWAVFWVVLSFVIMVLGFIGAVTVWAKGRKGKVADVEGGSAERREVPKLEGRRINGRGRRDLVGEAWKDLYLHDDLAQSPKTNQPEQGAIASTSSKAKQPTPQPSFESQGSTLITSSSGKSTERFPDIGSNESQERLLTSSYASTSASVPTSSTSPNAIPQEKKIGTESPLQKLQRELTIKGKGLARKEGSRDIRSSFYGEERQCEVGGKEGGEKRCWCPKCARGGYVFDIDGASDAGTASCLTTSECQEGDEERYRESGYGWSLPPQSPREEEVRRSEVYINTLPATPSPKFKLCNCYYPTPGSSRQNELLRCRSCNGVFRSTFRGGSPLKRA